MKLSSIITLLGISVATAIAQKDTQGLSAAACSELSEAVMAQASNGHLAEAKALLARATVPERVQDACAGIVLGRMAGITAILGRLAEAERLAEQSVRVLENFYPQNDWMLLRPLQILAVVRLESGQISRAREPLRRIQSIPIERPEDRAMVHGTVGVLLHMEGRRSEAEGEYQDALRGYEEAGRGESADAAGILHCLSALYLKEQRLDEARRALDRSLVIHDRAKDSLPIDRIRFLHLRAILHGRLGEWLQSEQDLRDALAMADREPYADTDLLRLMLRNYSYVLRRNHHRREARSIEARKAALPTDRTTAAVVDSTELLLESQRKKDRSVDERGVRHSLSSQK